MKKFLIFALAALISVAALAAEKNKRTFQVGDFESISIEGSIRVEFMQSKTTRVWATGPSESLKALEVSVSDGKQLRVRYKKGIRLHGINRLTVYVQAPSLSAIDIAGSGSFKAERGIVGKRDFIVQLAGSGNVTIADLRTTASATFSLAGSGDINIKRLQAKRVTTSLAGSGDIEFNAQGVGQTDISLAGSGDIKANFSQGCGAIEATVAGSGDIRLSGEAASLKKQKMGSGKVDDADLDVKHIK